MERIHEIVIAEPVQFIDHNIITTFSAGIAGWRPTIDLPLLKQKADEAMYKAKKRGKNQIVIEG